MKLKFLLLFIFLPIFASTKAQINFEKGYYINNNGDKIECLIKNEDWRNNPELINYKLNEGGEIKSFGISNVKEFGIYDSSKFIRENVEIEFSRLNINEITENRKLDFESKTLYLRVLAEGKANLYSFRKPGIIKYFYSVEGSKIEQLIYHHFLISDTRNKIVENTQYKGQLRFNVSCGNKSSDELEYKTKDLVSYFDDYNICSGIDTTSYFKEKGRKGKVNLYAKIGVELNHIELFGNITFDDKAFLTYGVELEYILPFNNNKWGAFVAAMYRDIETEGIRKLSSVVENRVGFDYQSIETGLGLRHHFFLDDNSSLFLDGAININFVLGDLYRNVYFIYEANEVVDGVISPINIKTDSFQVTYSFGAGFKYKNSYLKVNNATNNHIYGRTLNEPTNYTKFVISVGYNFL